MLNNRILMKNSFKMVQNVLDFLRILWNAFFEHFIFNKSIFKFKL